MSNGDPQCSECGQFLVLGHRITCSRHPVHDQSEHLRVKTATEVMQRERSAAVETCAACGCAMTRLHEEMCTGRAAPLESPADPWAHRSAKMRCRTCMWWVQKDLSEGGMTHGVSRVNGKTVATRRMGRCRRHAPTLNGYPAVWSDDWCGDHKLDEAKA